MKRSFIYILILALGLIGLVLLRRQTTANLDSSKPTSVTSFYPMYFFTSVIAGDKFNVINITPANAEPHDYEPTSGQFAQVENAKLLVLNGVVEPWANKVKNALIAGNGIIKDNDPHVWLNRVLAKKEVDNILAGFLKVDTQNKAYYIANAQKLKDQLDQLDKEFKSGLSACQKKDIVTSHEAFSYLAK